MHIYRFNKQSGLALITVLFIFALVSMLAISMQQRQSMDVAQASITFTQAQTQILALSVEDIAKAALSFDLQRDIEIKEEWDTASELWNIELPTPIKLDDALVSIKIRDLQGLFNLNSLNPKVANSTAALARFQRLLTEIETSARISIDSSVAQNVRNWLTEGHSANYDYQNETPPYRASEIEFKHPSELKLVKGVDNETYLFIEPYITALPSSVALNINTTDPKVLSSWDPILTTSQSEALVGKSHSGKCGNNRNTAVYKDVDEFWQTPEMTKVTNKTTNPTGQWDKKDFTVKSEYFSVFIQVKLGDRSLVSESIFRRKPYVSANDPDFIGVIYRDQSRTTEDITRLNIVKCTR